MKRLSDILRKEIKTCPESCYRISKNTGVDKAVLSRFMRGGSLKIETVEILLAYFKIDLVKRKGGRK